MFNRFLENHLPGFSRHLGAGLGNQPQTDRSSSGRPTSPAPANPLLSPLVGDNGPTQASAQSRLDRILGYFTVGAPGSNETRSASATTDATPDTRRFPPITQLIHRVKTCEPAEAPALIADLRQALHLRDTPPRLEIPAVRAILKSDGWIDAIVAGQLDLASLLPVIAQMQGLAERRALMGAIEAAVEVRQNADPDFAGRIQDRLGVPAAPPELPADAVQAKVLSLWENPDTRRHIDAITNLFRKLGTGTVPAQAVAVNLSTFLNRIGFQHEIPPELAAGIMPRLIENLLHRGDIDMGHARIARLAAERVREYMVLRQRHGGTDAARQAPLLPPWSSRLLWACIDEPWLKARLANPDTYHEIVPVNHRFGRLSWDHGVRLIGKDLLETIGTIESAGFLQASTSAQLRARLPDLLNAIYRENRRLCDDPQEGRMPQRQATTAAPLFTRAQLMQHLETMDSPARVALMEDLLAFFRNGTVDVEGAAFTRRYGGQMFVLLTDSEMARAVLVRLKQLERESNHPAAQTTTGSGSRRMPNRS